jgi:hypothetical protein
MHLPSRKRIGELLILFAIVAVVVSIGTSALTTSEVGNKPANDTTTDRGRTLVGMQSASQVVAFDSNGDTVWRISGEQMSYFDVTKLENGTYWQYFSKKTGSPADSTSHHAPEQAFVLSTQTRTRTSSTSGPSPFGQD